MHIEKIKLYNFKRFEARKTSPEDKQEDDSLSPVVLQFEPGAGANVLYGENGAGKSSILKAICQHLSWYIARLRSQNGSGWSMDKDTDIHIHHQHAYVEMQVCDECGKSITSTVAVTRPGFNSFPVKSDYKAISEWANHYRDVRDSSPYETHYPLFAFYGCHRAFIDIPQRIRKKHSFGPLDGYDEVLHGDSNFRTFVEWFGERETFELRRMRDSDGKGYQDPCLEAVRHALHRLIPELSRFRMSSSSARAMLANKGEDVFEIDNFSDGEKCLFALVGDIARRLAILNTRVKEPGGPPLLSQDDILAGEGIVLIDEIDLHLHPTWQRRVTERLPDVFPGLQFILTTHSPQVLGGVDAERIFDVSRIDEQNHISASIAGKGLSSNEVLRILMSASEREDSVTKQISRVRQYMDMEDWKGATTQLKKLQSMMTKPENVPALQELGAEIYLLSLEADD